LFNFSTLSGYNETIVLHISNFAEARAVLLKTVPPAGSMHNNYKLDRMRQLMESLGNPQNELKIIHVAGTSGKTSTCYYIAATLQAAGQKVGLTISPHVDEVNERIQINLVPLAEKEFCQELEEFLNLVQKTKLELTYFELLVAFAFWEFKKQAVDYAAVEVGLGGLFDGTNVITSPKKVCVITDIGFDHTDILGNTLSAIATQKAGIIGKHNPVFTYIQELEVRQVIEATCEDKAADLHSLTMPALDDLPTTLPLFQRRNWYLAEQVSRFVLDRDHLSQPNKETWLRAADTHIPARMEITQSAGKTIVIDAAHNTQKMQTLVTSLKDRFPGQTMAVLLALVRGSGDEQAAGGDHKPTLQNIDREDVVTCSWDGTEISRKFEFHVILRAFRHHRLHISERVGIEEIHRIRKYLLVGACQFIQDQCYPFAPLNTLC